MFLNGNNSVITQAANPNGGHGVGANEVTLPIHTNMNNGSKKANGELVYQNDDEHHQIDDADIDATTPFKGTIASQAGLKEQRKRKGLLRSLFCCFSSSSSSSDLIPSSKSAQKYLDPDANNNNPSSHNHMSTSVNDSVNIPQNEKYLLPPLRKCDPFKKCLVIDLDETLVHSSFKPVPNADFIVPVEIEGIVHQVYVLKRPFVDDFLKRMGQLYECILFTASLAKYADPVSDLLDKWGVFRGRLFREACVYYRGNYVKDLSKLGRDIDQVLILDNSPASYMFHPDNAVPVTSWFDDMNDTELHDLIEFMDEAANKENVYTALNTRFSKSRTGLSTGTVSLNGYNVANANANEAYLDPQHPITQVPPMNHTVPVSPLAHYNANDTYMLNDSSITIQVDAK